MRRRRRTAFLFGLLLLVSTWSWAEAKRQYTNAKDGSTMVLVPGGEVSLGGEGTTRGPMPFRSVHVPAFHLGKCEVTKGQWKRFTDAKPEWRKSQIPDAYHNGEYLQDWKGESFEEGAADHPVVYVSWFAARAYCEWAGGRLSTPEEWEKAARGEDRRVYPWGNQWDRTKCNCASYWAERELANASERRAFWKGGGWKKLKKMNVGSFQGDVGPYGILGMAASVREYTNTQARPIRGGTETRYWACGSSWATGVRTECYVTTRINPTPDQCFGDVGLRLCVPVHHVPDDTSSTASGLGDVAEQSRPTNAGVLRLVRGWRWCDRSTVLPGGPTGDLPTDQLVANQRGVLALDRLRGVGRNQRSACDRLVWTQFRVPESWRGRTVWLTYDAIRLAQSRICEVWLNGRRLKMALPVSTKAKGTGGTYWPRYSLDLRGGHPAAPWFVDVGNRLSDDGPNTLVFRVQQWPLIRNAGAWLYCQPASERVLFLQSEGLPRGDSGMISSYASHVKKHFAVEPILQTRSFETPESLRRHLQRCHAEEGIGGAVLIGKHPFPAFHANVPKRFGATDGGFPRYYEDLDAEFSDTDGDGVLDTARAQHNYGAEIWTAWIRRHPGIEGEKRFAAYFRKVIDYYEGRLYYPANQLLMVGNERVDGVGLRNANCGREMLDHLLRPSDYAEIGGHGYADGIHTSGPHGVVSIPDALNLYPGSLAMESMSCWLADIRTPGLTPAEAYVFGRGNTQCGIGNARKELWNDHVSRLLYGAAQWVRKCPNLTAMYTWRSDMRGTQQWDYYNGGDVLLGNPFVSLSHDFAARSQAVKGRVFLAASGPASGFYVEAARDGQSFGRFLTKPDGSYKLECLPVGTYKVRLHLNACEQLVQQATVGAVPDSAIQLDFRVDRTWRVSGQVRKAKGGLGRRGWVEMAERPEDKLFRSSDMIASRTDDQGRFEIIGLREGTFWIRGCCNGASASAPTKVEISEGEQRPGTILQVGK